MYAHNEVYSSEPQTTMVVKANGKPTAPETSRYTPMLVSSGEPTPGAWSNMPPTSSVVV